MTIAYKHKSFTNTALPYITNAAPTDPRARYVTGSSNLMTSVKGYAERRPGVTSFAATNPGFVHRIFTWRRWDGSFFVMESDTTGSTGSTMRKLEVGTDSDWVTLKTLTVSAAQHCDFVVSNNHVFGAVDVADADSRWKYDGTDVTLWGITAPASAVSTALGGSGLTATRGYKYVICWENEDTGHLSSPSPIMASRVVPADDTITITGNTTTDAQVTHVRVFRTTDGGSIYFEHPSSPVAYATWVASGLADSSADTALLSTTAPLQNQNNRPPQFKGPVFWNGRIWGFKGDKVYFSALEEMKRNHGVPAEAFPPDNFYPFGAEVTALGVTQDALIVHAPPVIYRITGDTRATFARDVLTLQAGARNREATCSAGRVHVWLDFSNTVRVTDGLSVQEISLPIRPDIASIVHSTANMAVHNDGVRHWIVLMDGTNGKLFVYDQDLSQWMPPWSISGIQGIHSGETAAGTVKLFIGRSTAVFTMDTSSYLDGSTAFEAHAVMGNVEIAGSPDSLGDVQRVALETGEVMASAVGLLTDDDPEAADVEHTQLTTVTDAPNRKQGTALKERHYQDETTRRARRASVKVDWDAEDENFALYTIDTAYTEIPA